MTMFVNEPMGAPTVRLELSPARRGRLWPWGLAVVVVLGAGAAVAGWHGHLALPLSRLTAAPEPSWPLLTVDQGVMAAVVTEAGVLESSDNAVVKCRVEALVALSGAPGGVAAGAGANRPNPSPGSSPDVSNRSAAMIRATTPSTNPATVAAAASGAAPAPASNASSSSGSSGGQAVSIAPAPKPQIRSFTYSVSTYSPMRSITGNAVGQRRAGSTTILSIVDEGTRVKEGDIVCELDSSNLREEVRIQQIRYLEAKSALEQVKSTLEVSEIALREYREAILPQDLQQVHQYLDACFSEQERAERNLKWSIAASLKGMRAPNQVRADELALEQTRFRVRDAEHMADRLEKYTGPRLIAKLEARLEAIKSDLYAEEAAAKLEEQRLKRLEQAVANCTLRAPRDGVVVYYKPTNGWGRAEVRIQEGMVVREGQTLIELPDPKHLRVRARVNESKVSLIRPGMAAQIVVDAFPDQRLEGVVAEVTPIPIMANGPISDVKIYHAIIDITHGFNDEFRPGLSADVGFVVHAGRSVTRLPLAALRWHDGQAYAAVVRTPRGGADSSGNPIWQWRAVTIGQTDDDHAEVVSGLSRGERVIATPEKLPAPHSSHPWRS